MTIKIVLRLHGLDLRDVAAYERIPGELAELSFQANGGVSVAVLYADTPPAAAAAEAADWARRIDKLVPGVRVTGAHEELVSLSDIATRCEMAAEAVRLWSTGKRRSGLRPFPVPREVVSLGTGGRSMNIYSWPAVLEWVRDVIGIDPDEGISYLDARQLAHLNAELKDLDPTADTSDSGNWRSMPVACPQRTATVSRARDLSTATAYGDNFLMERIDDLLADNDISGLRAMVYR